MKIIDLFATPMHNCEDAAAHLLNALNIKYTKSILQKELTEHPNYPSMASIADIIGIFYDVACAPLKISFRNFVNAAGFTLPVLAQMGVRGKQYEVFVVIKSIKNNSVLFYNPESRKEESLSIETFEKLFTGMMLIAERGSKLEEENYILNRKLEKESEFYRTLTFLTIPCLTILGAVLYLYHNPTYEALSAITFMFLMLTGTIISAFLAWYEIDQYNPIAKQICGGNKQTNCAAVLNSKFSKFGGQSWSVWGFVYFLSMLFSLLFSGLSKSALFLSAWISLISVPYIIFSIFYQWKIVKHWCPLCLAVQATILLSCIIAFIGGHHRMILLDGINPFAIFAFAAYFIVFFSVMTFLMPALKKAKNSQLKTIQLQRIKHNTQVFEGVLLKQKQISKPAKQLGITIGDPESAFKLIKVCNPYCGPCALAHPIIEDLIKNNKNLSAQIIFTANEGDNDMKREPVLHLLAIDEMNDKMVTMQALDDWYLPRVKNYPTFASKYPVDTTLKNQTEKVREMRQWCDQVGINFTPTFFISFNNQDKDPLFFQLPDMYSVNDLKYFFTV